MTTDPNEFEIEQAETRTLVVSVVDEQVPPQPVDLTTATDIRWTAARTPRSWPATISKSLGNGLSIVDAAGGVFHVELFANDTRYLDGVYLTEARVDLPAGSSPVLKSRMTVLESNAK